MNEMSEGMKVLLQYAASLGPYNKQEPSLDREDIISMAREVGMSPSAEGLYWTATSQDLERFASIVASHVK
jgi:hypothetical protein